MSSASIWVTRGEQQWWRVVAAVAAMAMVATGMITVLPLTASATSVGSQDDTAGVFLYNAGSDTQGFLTPPPGPCAGVASSDPTNETVQIAVDTGNVLYFIGDEASETVAFTLGAEGERAGGTPDSTEADVNLGLSGIDDYGFVGNATGASDDNSNYDAQTGGDVTLQLDIDGTFAAPGGTDIALIVPDGVVSTGTLENDPADPFGNLDGAEIFIFEDAETSGMTIELFGPGLSGPYVIGIDDYQRNPDTFQAADDTLIAIDLDSLPGFTFPYVEQIRITDDGIAVNPNISTCPGPNGAPGAVLDTSLELDAVATRTDTVLAGPPAIDIEKATNGQDADVVTGPQLEVGSPVTWTYVVTNTGETPLINVTVTDDQGVVVDCGGGSNVVAGPIQPNGSFTCTGTGIAVAGQYTNNSTVIGTPTSPLGDPLPQANVSDSDPSNYIGIAPAVDIEKFTNGVQSDVAPGETVGFESLVTWTYVVTNTGTADLTNLTVTDDIVAATDIDCGTGTNVIASIPVGGAAVTCTATGSAILGQYSNVSDVVATPVDGGGNPLPSGTVDDTDPSHYVGTASAAIDIEKDTNGFQADNPPGQSIPVDGPITWTYSVTNTGTTNLINATVVDSIAGVTVDCGGGTNVIAGTLAPNATFDCTASGVATFGQYENTGTVVADPADAAGVIIPGLNPVDDSDLSHYIGTATASVDIEKATNTIDADTPTGPSLVVGDTVTWTYVVTNTGTTDLINLVVTDDDPTVVVDCGGAEAGPLAANGGTFTCTATGSATAGQYANVADVVGTPADAAGNPIVGLANVVDDDPSHYIGQTPSISLQKATNGVDADVAPGPAVAVGDTVTWRYTVTNTSQVTLSAVTVTDDIIPASDINCGAGDNIIASMAPGDIVECFASGPATFGQYANVGDVTGQPVDSDGNPVGTPVTATDPSHYIGTATPSVDIEKATEGQDADTITGPELVLGDTVTWTYVVTNDGTTDLINLIVTDDDPTVSVDCGNGNGLVAGPIAASGGTFTCTATGTVTAGQYVNTSDVIGTPADQNGNAIVGLADVVDDDPSHYIGLVPSITLEKATNGQDADTPAGPQVAVDGAITWSYVVTNTSQVTLTQVTIADDQGVVVLCPSGTNVIGTLAPGASRTCTGTGTADLGQYANIGAVTAQPVDEDGNAVGDPVTDDDPSHYFGLGTPAVDIEKTTNTVQADTGTGPSIPVGDPVTWTYTVVNTGDTPLVNFVVNDSDIGVTPDCGGGSNVVAGPIDPLGTFTCTASGTATADQYNNDSDVSADPVDENGVALTDPTGAPLASVVDEDPSAYFGAEPAVEIVKRVNGNDANTAPGSNVPVGSTLNWSFDVTNTGNVDLTALTVSDPDLTGIDCGTGTATVAGPIIPGGTYTCTATSIAAVGQVLNTADVDATPVGPDGTTLPVVNDDDPANYFGGDAAVDIEKATNGSDADTPTGPVLVPGDTVTWTYVVTNTGTVDLDNVLVTDDDPAVTVTCPGGNPITLLTTPAGTLTCTATGIAVPGQYTNTATVVGDPANGDDPVTDSDPSHYRGAFPQIDIEKTTNGIQADTGTGPYIPVGEPVTWTYVVTNTGNVTLDPIVVTDDQGVVPVCVDSSLIQGASTTCTATGLATAGQYNNEGTVTGQPVDENGAPLQDEAGTVVSPVTDMDPSAYFGAEALIDIEKATNGVDSDTAPGNPLGLGDTVTWTYVVENTGNVDLALVTVTDDQGVTVDCGGGSSVIALLAPGAGNAVICSGTAPAELGQYTNLADVTGNPVDAAGDPILDAAGAPLAPVVDDDPSNYFGVGEPALTLVKLVNDSDANTAPGISIVTGAPVSFDFIVTNTGDVDLVDVTLGDTVTAGTASAVTVVCPSGTNVIGQLDVGQTRTCTGTGTAVSGQHTNMGDVVGDPVDENGAPLLDIAGLAVASPTAMDPANYFGGESAIDIEKATNTDDADVAPGPSLLVGEAVTWTYVVTNTGNLDLTDVTVTDNIVAAIAIDCGAGSNVIASLPVGSAPVTCTAEGVAEDGQYENTGSVSGTDTNLGTVTDTDLSHYIAVEPAVTLEKATNGEDADVATGPSIAVGDTVTWTYVVTNTGSAELTNVTVTDDIVADADIDCGGGTNVIASLAVGAPAVTCTAVGTATAGQYTNLGTVTADPVDVNGDPIGTPQTAADPSNYFGGEPGLSLEKTTNTEDADVEPGPIVAVGDTITWIYTVSNDGNVPLTAVTVTDDLVADADIDCGAGTNVIASLAGGTTTTCTATGTAVAGQYANTGTVTGLDPDSNELTDSDPSHYFAADPSVLLEKATNGTDADAAPGPSIQTGEAVTWTYVVTNTGNVELTNVTVSDNLLADADIDCGGGTNVVASLAVGADPVTCTAVGVAIDGAYTNTGSVSADPVLPSGDPVPGGPVTDDDPSNYTGTPEPLGNIGDYVWIDLNADGVQDAGEEPIAGVVLTLTDSNGDVVGTQTTDAAGAYLFTALPGDTYTVTVDQSTIPAGYAPTFDADGGFDEVSIVVLPAGEDNLDQDFGYVPPPAIELEKSTNGTDADAAPGVTIQVGDDVTWTYEVTNTGPVTMTNINVTDNLLADTAIDCGAGSNIIATLAAGDSATCTATGIATEGQYTNVGLVSGDGPNGETVRDTDPSNYLGTPEPLGTIGDYVWLDANRDGIQQASETGLAGIDVTLVAADGTITTTQTDANGNYLFGSLPAGDYTVTVSKAGAFPAGAVQTFDASGDQLDHTSTLTLGAGETNLEQDFGYALPNGTIGDTIWFDADRDGVIDADESGIPNVTLQLVDSDGTMVETTTDADGMYLFTGLPAGDYTVIVVKADTVLATSERTFDPDGTLDNTSTLTLAEGEDNLDQDFGYAVPDGVIGDTVWFDQNQDGVIDADEAGIPGVPIQLIDANGDVVQTVTTDADGMYLFTAVPGGTYTVSVVKSGTVLETSFRTYDADGIDGDSGNVSTLTLPEGGANLDQDFGYAPAASIGNFIFLDENSNGIQDTGETGVAGATVNLYEVDSTGTAGTVAIASVTTGADGEYSFTNLDPTVDYQVQVVTPAGTVVTTRDAGDDDAVDSDIDPVTGVTAVIDLSAGEQNFTFDAGIVPLVAGVDIEKSTQTPTTAAVDADTPATAPVLIEGDTVTWTYLVTNTGGTDLVNIVVTDDREGVINCPQTTLAVGAQMNCVKTGTVELQISPARYTNIGAVTATPAGPDGTPLPGRPSVTDEDPSNYTSVIDQRITRPTPTPVPATVTPVPAQPTAVVVVVVVTPTPDPKSIAILFTPRDVQPPTTPPLALTGRNSTDFALVAGSLIIAGAAFVALGRRRSDDEVEA